MLLAGGALGASSYSIYLWHMPFAMYGQYIVRWFTGENSFVLYFMFYVAGALGFGLLMNKVVEWPALKLRDRLFPTDTHPCEVREKG